MSYQNEKEGNSSKDYIPPGESLFVPEMFMENVMTRQEIKMGLPFQNGKAKTNKCLW